jgi:hypothetical protein
LHQFRNIRILRKRPCKEYRLTEDCLCPPVFGTLKKGPPVMMDVGHDENDIGKVALL